MLLPQMIIQFVPPVERLCAAVLGAEESGVGELSHMAAILTGTTECAMATMGTPQEVLGRRLK